MELEKTVRMMERNVIAMEAGNHETDDSDAKQKYEGQKQLNIQLMEQKRWLEHELEEIKLKIQVSCDWWRATVLTSDWSRTTSRTRCPTCCWTGTASARPSSSGSWASSRKQETISSEKIFL